METTNKLLTIDEARSILRVGRNTMYNLVREGLPCVRLGKQIRIPSASMNNWINEMTKNNI